MRSKKEGEEGKGGKGGEGGKGGMKGERRDELVTKIPPIRIGCISICQRVLAPQGNL